MIKLQSDPKPVNVSTLLKDSLFRIPKYQRPYKWGMDHLEQFYESIEQDEDEFIGSFFFLKTNSHFEVIDGQQRLTTIFLFLKACQIALKESNSSNRIIVNFNEILFYHDSKTKKESLRLNPQDIFDSKNIFHNLIHNDEPIPKEAKFYKDKKFILKKELKTISSSSKKFKLLSVEINNLENAQKLATKYHDYKNTTEEKYKKALLFFYEKIIMLKTDEIIQRKNSLMNKLFCLRLTTSSIVDVNTYFNNLNAKGLQLDKEDIIKNSLYILDNKFNSIKTFEEISEKLESYDLSFDDYLYYFINFIANRFDCLNNFMNSNHIIPEKKIIVAFHKLIQEFGSNELVEELKKMLDKYIMISKPKKFWKYKERKVYYYFALNQFFSKKAISFLLRTQNIYTSNQYESLLKITTYILVKHAVLKSEPKKLETFFGNAKKLVKTKNDFGKILSSLQKTDSFVKDITHEDFGKYSWTNNQSLAINLLLYIDEIVEFVRFKGEEEMPIIDKISLEHIFPQTPENNVWYKKEILDVLYKNNKKPKEDDKKSSFKLYSNQIGNHVILNSSQNKSAKNSCFDNKKEYLKESSFILTKVVADEPIWCQTSISKRNIDLFNRFEKLKIIT
jgi:uncharacterized protein with ParB-like and HNH nuclease domain